MDRVVGARGGQWETLPSSEDLEGRQEAPGPMWRDSSKYMCAYTINTVRFTQPRVSVDESSRSKASFHKAALALRSGDSRDTKEKEGSGTSCPGAGLAPEPHP